MSKYDERVNALREHADLIETSIELYGPSATRLLVYDLRNAAAAIEALQAEVDTLKRTDSKRCQECLYLGQPVGEQLIPKRGEWYKPYGFTQKSYKRICTNCQDVAYFCGKGNYRYCPNCGAKMEVQDG